ncbi:MULTISPECIES: hypothetical protein [unclassified Paenibacillus]|uniref:hypothetical protein n=1 Tax=unclassified Paenibacillus TaxID=185978 RepID=UPI002405E503|nr:MULTISPECIES: hypothetical protein [unclassified Paenibacillus]MDF9845173.1 hypothetical protein [Paenibacillus sp. PastF-2]MDF9850335.1 hypothetical protein [Paenibacillus sp. PastM-2]MDF9856962.1 hypothetical protein [Paenibacillus sp. PastF-1]MDH6482181.1 hypothetical protein [Paenibacillus sp. PastH-2]MDH6509655.1 hypothetical protein [Paenibacillus sp. PastM-3]
MTKVVKLSNKFAKDEKAGIEIGDKIYEFDASVETAMLLEDAVAGDGRVSSLVAALEGVLGAEAVEDIGVKKMSLANMKILITGLSAALQGTTYEDASARFQR